MSWRFRDSIKLFPGVRLNVSKGGLSTSIGGPGATINLGRRGTRGTIGLPGTGISYSQLFGTGAPPPSSSDENGDPLYDVGEKIGRGCWSGCILLIGIVVAALFLVKWTETIPTPPIAKSEQFASFSSESPSVTAQESAYISAGVLNGRAEPNTQSAILTKLQRGDVVSVQERRGDWTKVVKGAITVWLISKHLSASPVSPPAIQTKRATLFDARTKRKSVVKQSRNSRSFGGGSCSCSAGNVCVGPRGGRYCITSGGSKRYGV